MDHRREQLLQALSTLTPTQRAALLLRGEGRSRAEVSAAMGLSPHRVRNLWNEGRKRVRQAMPPELLSFYDAIYGGNSLPCGSTSNIKI